MSVLTIHRRTPLLRQFGPWYEMEMIMWWVIVAAVVVIGLGFLALVLDDMQDNDFNDVPPGAA